ncbi:MAG: hypothetical protein QXO03_02660 [Thermoplasmatales archaeon]
MPPNNFKGMILKDRILDILGGDGKSISEIYKEINMDEETKIHRLALTGYLWAMADLNILREKYVKPSKIYYPIKRDERSIYQIVAEQVSNDPIDKRGEEVLYVLYTLFERPIFENELEKAGITGNVKAKRLDKKERKKLLSRADIKIKKIPPDDDAYIPITSYPALTLRILSKIISQAYDIKRENNGIQKELDSLV